jgi:copper(I)-binding protein
MRKIALAVALLASGTIAAYGQTPSISVENAWSRPTPPMAKTGVVYFTVVDHGAPDRLMSAATPVAGMAELHQTIRNGNVMKMRPVASLPVSSAKPITFGPGGYHVMLMDLKQPLAAGQSFPLTLTFQNAGPVSTTVMVKGTGAASSAPMKGMDMPMTGQPKP